MSIFRKFLICLTAICFSFISGANAVPLQYKEIVDFQKSGTEYTIPSFGFAQATYVDLLFQVKERGATWTGATDYTGKLYIATSKESTSPTVVNCYSQDNTTATYYFRLTPSILATSRTYFTQLILENKTNSAVTVEAGRGLLNVLPSPATNPTSIWGPIVNWDTITGYRGTFPLYSPDQSISITSTTTGALLRALSALVAGTATNSLDWQADKPLYLLNNNGFATNLSVYGLTSLTNLNLNNSYITNISMLQLNPIIDGFATEGQMYWDTEDHTLTLVSDQANTKLQVGQEQWIRVVNKSGHLITNGNVVACTSGPGNRIRAILADMDDSNASRVIGVATQNITNNQEGWVTSFGLVRDIDTRGFTEGSAIYASTNSGMFVTNYLDEGQIAPTFIGRVLVSAHNGTIFVNVANKETDPIWTNEKPLYLQNKDSIGSNVVIKADVATTNTDVVIVTGGGYATINGQYDVGGSGWQKQIGDGSYITIPLGDGTCTLTQPETDTSTVILYGTYGGTYVLDLGDNLYHDTVSGNYTDGAILYDQFGETLDTAISFPTTWNNGTTGIYGPLVTSLYDTSQTAGGITFTDNYSNPPAPTGAFPISHDYSLDMYYPFLSNPSNYLTQAVGDGLYYPLNANPAGYLTTFSETDPVWNADKASYATTSSLALKIANNSGLATNLTVSNLLVNGTYTNNSPMAYISSNLYVKGGSYTVGTVTNAGLLIFGTTADSAGDVMSMARANNATESWRMTDGQYAFVRQMRDAAFNVYGVTFYGNTAAGTAYGYNKNVLVVTTAGNKNMVYGTTSAHDVNLIVNGISRLNLDDSGTNYLGGCLYATNCIISGGTVTATNVLLSADRWIDSAMIFEAKNAGLGTPTYAALPSPFNGISTLEFKDNDEISFMVQFNHNIAPSNNVRYVEPHAHVLPTSVPDATHQWTSLRIIYAGASIDGILNGPWTNTVSFNVGTNKHSMVEFSHLMNSTWYPGISGKCWGTIKRIPVDTSTNFTGNISVDGDFHYPIDRFGSASDSAP